MFLPGESVSTEVVQDVKAEIQQMAGTVHSSGNNSSAGGSAALHGHTRGESVPVSSEQRAHDGSAGDVIAVLESG